MKRGCAQSNLFFYCTLNLWEKHIGAKTFTLISEINMPT